MDGMTINHIVSIDHGSYIFGVKTSNQLTIPKIFQQKKAVQIHPIHGRFIV